MADNLSLKEGPLKTGVGPWRRTDERGWIGRVIGLSEDSPCPDTDPIASTSSARSPKSFSGCETLHGLAKRHDISRNLIRVWVEKYEAGALDEDARAADLVQEYEARIAALERLVGRQALELEFLKGALKSGPQAKSATTSVITGPTACPSSKDVS